MTADMLEGSSIDIEDWIRSLAPDNAETYRFRQLMDVRADWERRFGRTRDFEAALVATAQVIAGTCVGVVGTRGVLDIEFDLCIIDEGSKATPTELLVPLSRSRSWILVGDPKQLPPFQEDALDDQSILARYDLTPDDVRESLFERLFNRVPLQCKTSLTIQHRMVTPIGNLISECFYEGQLQSARTEINLNLTKVFATPVVWLSTSHLSNPKERKRDLSCDNPSEVRAIRKLLEVINSELTRRGAKARVAVLSGYLAQVGALLREVEPKRDLWSALQVEINTVDAFQGREADIAIYSVTRSNDQRKIGFLRDLRRLNVALSRGRDYLVIVGDHMFAKSVDGYNPFARVLEHIATHPTECSVRPANL